MYKRARLWRVYRAVPHTRYTGSTRTWAHALQDRDASRGRCARVRRSTRKRDVTTGTTITTTMITTGSSPRRQQRKLTCITSYDHYVPLDERDAASFITPDRTRESSSSGTTVTSAHTYARRKSGKLDERTVHREKANRILYRSFLPPFLSSSSFPSFHHLIFLRCFLISWDIGFYQLSHYL